MSDTVPILGNLVLISEMLESLTTLEWFVRPWIALSRCTILPTALIKGYDSQIFANITHIICFTCDWVISICFYSHASLLKVVNCGKCICHVRQYSSWTLLAQTWLTVILEICDCVDLFQHALDSSSSQSRSSLHLTTHKEAEQAGRASHEKSTVDPHRTLNLHQPSGIKNLITKFTDPDYVSYSSSPQSPLFGAGRVRRFAYNEALNTPKSTANPLRPSTDGHDRSPVASSTVNPVEENDPNGLQAAQSDPRASEITLRVDRPAQGSMQKTDSAPRSKAQTTDSGRDSVDDSGMGSVRN